VNAHMDGLPPWRDLDSSDDDTVETLRLWKERIPSLEEVDQPLSFSVLWMELEKCVGVVVWWVMWKVCCCSG